MVTTNSTQEVQIIEAVLEEIKPYLKYMVRPWADGSKYLVCLGRRREKNNEAFFLDRKGNWYYEFVKHSEGRTEVAVDQDTLGYLLTQVSFSEIIEGISSVLEKKNSELIKRAVSIEQVKKKIKGLVGAVILSDVTEEVGELICITEVSLFQEDEFVMANFGLFCPRHQDGHCDALRVITVPVARFSVLGANVYEILTPKVKSVFCPGETCGVHYQISLRGIKELKLMTVQFLVQIGYRYVMSK